MGAHPVWLAMAILAQSVAAAQEEPVVGRGDELLPPSALVRLGTVPPPAAKAPPSVLFTLQLTTDGKRALTWGNDNIPRLWNLNTGEVERRFQPHVHSSGLAMTPDDKTLLAVSDQGIVAFSIATGEPVPVPAALSKMTGVIQLQVGDGRSIVTGEAKSVEIWNWPDGRLRRKIELMDDFDSLKPFALSEAQLSADGRRLITRMPAGAVDIWNAETGAHLVRLRGASQAIPQGIALLNGGRELALRGGNLLPDGNLNLQEDPLFAKRLGLWDLSSGRLIRAFDAPRSRSSRDVAADPRGYLVAAVEIGNEAANDEVGFVAVYEAASGQIRRSLHGHFNRNTALAFTPDGRRLVTFSGVTTGFVWDMSLASSAKDKKTGIEADLERAWTTLAQTDAVAAYEALKTLANDSELAIKIILQRLRPLDGLDVAGLDRLVADLASDSFVVRAKASDVLEKRGRTYVAALKARVDHVESLEARRRLTALLDRFESGPLLPDELRAARSIELLESIGTPATRAAIAELANGEPIADVTIRALAAKTRLDRH